MTRRRQCHDQNHAARERIRLLMPIGWVIVAVFIPIRHTNAQLISPGKLADAHSHLTGLTSCTKCHRLGSAGVERDKCLECHVPLKNRLIKKHGYHATLEEKDCAKCHKDHFGADFDMIRLDTASFEHDTRTDYKLVGAHAEAECRSCHAPEYIEADDVREFKSKHSALDRTYLGLVTTCVGCHAEEDPHRDQFKGESCEECHEVSDWEEAELFDHDRSQFRLVGKHRDVECEKCHEPVRDIQGEEYVQYVSIKFDRCQDCHRDEHEGERGDDCTRCHVNADWHRIKSETFEDDFDHSTTEFELLGKHAEAECSTCHGKPPKRDEEAWVRFVEETRNFSYPHPVSDDCVSCHRDYHRGVFEESEGGIVCDNCHDNQGWLPAVYDIERHNQDSAYTLEDAHLATPCQLCHPEPDPGQEAQQFDIPEQECESCHAEDDPHEKQFGDAACKECHDTIAFLVPDYDHSETEFPLDGEHQNVPCASCHPEEPGSTGELFVRYKPLETGCRDCHGGR